MGSAVRKVMSEMSKPLKNFNVESRAHKVISRAKPTAAPRHKKDQVDYDRIMREYPEVYEESLKKHSGLDKNLQNVYVQSFDPINSQTPPPNPDRPLPLDRRLVDDFEYGAKEPEKIPVGKATLRQVLKFITDHQSDSKTNTTEKIAKEYALPEQTVREVLKFFKVFEVYIPQERKVKAKFAGPSVPRMKIVSQSVKQLSAGEIGKDKM